jgi:uncharacterized membrane protein YeaQ/YmgE (transglycosylase-associated protein family)
MTLEAFLLWILVGLVAGFLADAAVGGISTGVVGDIIIGIIGALIGGWLFAQLGIFPGATLLGSILTAFVGAVILLLLLRALQRAT